jgi:hypothetical protein
MHLKSHPTLLFRINKAVCFFFNNLSFSFVETSHFLPLVPSKSALYYLCSDGSTKLQLSYSGALNTFPKSVSYSLEP